MNTRLVILVATVICFSGTAVSQHTMQMEDLRKKILFADSIKDNVYLYINQIKSSLGCETQIPEELSIHYYNLAICYAVKEQPDSAYYYLCRTLDHSSELNNIVYTDTDFEMLRNSPYWDIIVHKIDSAHLSMDPEIKLHELSIELYHIYLMDQHVRGLGLKGQERNTGDVDMENLGRLEEIIKQYGWPTFSMVGKTAAKGAFLVIQHANTQIQQKYLRQIIEAAKINEAHKEWVALLVDRISIHRTGTQIFGTQVYQIKDPLTGEMGKYRFFPIKDIAIVDSLRISFDMIPLRDYYAGFGIDYKPVIK